MASCTPACSPPAATTCVRCCVAAPSDEELEASLRAIWEDRDDRYSEIRSAETVELPKVEMSYIGG